MELRTIVVSFAVLLAALPGSLRGQDSIRDVPDALPVTTTPRNPATPSARPAPSTTRQTTAAVTAAPAAAPGASLDARMARREADSLLRVIATMRWKVPADSAARQRYEEAVDTAWQFMAGWLVLMVIYLVWAVHRYVYNYGLSNREWKVLYPEIYENAFDRLLTRVTGSKSFAERRESLLEHRQRVQALLPVPGKAVAAAPDQDADAASGTSDARLLDEPTKNPYQGDSFGLPPGTIRGILALSALFTFLLMEGVNLHSPSSLEGQFDGLVTALQMVLAFYFGSRAVEVLQAKTTARSVETSAASTAGPAAPTAPAPGDGPAPAPAPAPPPGASPAPSADKSFLPENTTAARFDNVIVMAKNEPPAPAQAALSAATPLSKRVLALTAGFETGRGFPDCFGGLTGNFDRQGISFGALQWNIGQGSLQPLWKEMRDKNDAELKAILGNTLYDEFGRMLAMTQQDQMRWALEIQHQVSGRANTWKIADTWKNALQTLGKSAAMIDIQVRTASTLYQVALSFCADYGLTRERGAALMFDIRVQNGSVDKFGSGDRMRADFAKINPSLSDDDQQVERMRIIAQRRAAVSKPEFQADVLSRKMAIVRGQGKVHGRNFDLDKEFAIGLGPIT